MSYSVEIGGDFKTVIKSLSKKYPSLKNDLALLSKSLKENPTQGDKIYKNTYKVRLAITSKGKGKSGGARVITHVVAALNAGTVYLLSIYDKSDQDSLSDEKLKALIEGCIKTK